MKVGQIEEYKMPKVIDSDGDAYSFSFTLGEAEKFTTIVDETLIFSPKIGQGGNYFI